MTQQRPTRVVWLLVCAVACSRGEAVSPELPEQTSPAPAETPREAAPAMGVGEAPAPEPAPAAVEACAAYATPEPRTTLPAAVDEASGMVVDGSSEAPFFWLINDSGDLARIYGVGADGALVTTALLDSIIAIDWEDMAEGTCGPSAPEAACLYVGDIGDNYRLRQWVPIHRLRVPALAPAFQRIVEGVETMRVAYPDGHHDAEALVVDETGRIFILSKDRNGTFSLYSAPFEANESAVTLEYHGTFDISHLPGGQGATVTAADFDPVGRRLLVRTYNAALEFRLAPGQPLQAVLGTEPQVVPTVEEPQGESIAYGQGGYWHVSEGAGPPLYFARCLAP